MKEIVVAARDSLLSRKQVEEVLKEVEGASDIPPFKRLFIKTRGDRDLTSSLRLLDKTDFFTQEIDRLLLEGGCDVAIHSAKDLPDPLPEGLTLITLTKGIDPSDSLVLREGERLEELPSGARIGSSSLRRDAIVSALRPDLLPVEVRGPVDRRLALLDRGEIDGLVVAEAALIRLGLCNRNRLSLPLAAAPLQGKLALIARTGDLESAQLFKRLKEEK